MSLLNAAGQMRILGFGQNNNYKQQHQVGTHTKEGIIVFTDFIDKACNDKT